MENKWKEVEAGKAKYGVILRAGGYETSAYFYESLEDLEWAMKNSWFDPREATAVKLLTVDYKIMEHNKQNTLLGE
tara:strand:- start:8320 stop:8547 length:228 start_codon:yes stop_codon:yes gene_type:complete